MAPATGVEMSGVADSTNMVAAIYDAAFAPDLWPRVLDGLRQMVDCRAGGLLYGTLKPVALTIKGASGMDSGIAGRVQEIFGDPAANPFIRNLARLKPGIPVPRQAFIDDDSFERHWVYREFFEPQGLFHDITTPLVVSPDEATTLYLGRGRDEGRLSDREVRILLPWIPHLQRALLIDRQLRMHRAGNHALVEVLDRVTCGVALVGQSGAVVLLNRAAENIVEAGDGLAFGNSRIAAMSRDDDTELNKAVAVAAAGQGGCCLLVRRSSGARPYVVFTVPLSRVVAASCPQAPAAAILFSDPESSVEPVPAMLAQLYGLSRAETAVAVEAAKGQGLDALAAQLGISRNTAKTHLGRVFGKTGACRQAELVRLLTMGSFAIAGPIGGNDEPNHAESPYQPDI